MRASVKLIDNLHKEIERQFRSSLLKRLRHLGETQNSAIVDRSYLIAVQRASLLSGVGGAFIASIGDETRAAGRLMLQAGFRIDDALSTLGGLDELWVLFPEQGESRLSIPIPP